MKRLFLAQLEQVLVGNDTVFDGVDPESPAASGMFSNGLAVLTGNGNFHIGNLSVCGIAEIQASIYAGAARQAWGNPERRTAIRPASAGRNQHQCVSELLSTIVSSIVFEQ
jgi:hypothetical protein